MACVSKSWNRKDGFRATQYCREYVNHMYIQKSKMVGLNVADSNTQLKNTHTYMCIFHRKVHIDKPWYSNNNDIESSLWDTHPALRRTLQRGSPRRARRGRAPCSYCCAEDDQRPRKIRAPAGCGRCGGSPDTPCRLQWEWKSYWRISLFN